MFGDKIPDEHIPESRKCETHVAAALCGGILVGASAVPMIALGVYGAPASALMLWVGHKLARVAALWARRADAASAVEVRA